MKKETQLERSLVSLTSHNKEGSFGTHSVRSKMLKSSMNELSQQYPRLKNVRELKTKHVDYLVENWKQKGLSAGTIKNRVSYMRWLSEKINKVNIVKRDNKAYGIDDRKYVDNTKNIAKKLSNEDLSKISNDYVRNSLRLQSEFGLRREEAIKFNPFLADKGDKIELKGSWCKGGREREIQIRTQEQRELINELKQFCKDKNCTAMIPRDGNYKQQMNAYKTQTYRAGLDNNHGLRHQYAQERYKELTGRECPKNGGLTSRELSPQEKEQDFKARMQISEELGHSRENITTSYLGR